MPLSDLMHEALDEAETVMANRGKVTRGLATGFVDMDRTLMGLKNGEMIVVAGRPSMGKTAFGLNIAQNVALGVNYDDFEQEPKPVAVFSLEMSRAQLAGRMLWGHAGLSVKRLRDGFVRKGAHTDLAEAANQLANARMWVDDTPALPIGELRGRMMLAKRRYKVELAVVDYLQLLKSTDHRMPREAQVAEISAGIKAMAKELDIPIIVLAQLNRAAEGDSPKYVPLPTLKDLRESGAIENDADVVLFPLRPVYYEQQGKQLRVPDHIQEELDQIREAAEDAVSGPVPGSVLPKKQDDYEGEPALVSVGKQRDGGGVGMQPLVWRKHLVRFDNPAGKTRLYTPST